MRAKRYSESPARSRSPTSNLGARNPGYTTTGHTISDRTVVSRPREKGPFVVVIFAYGGLRLRWSEAARPLWEIPPARPHQRRRDGGGLQSQELRRRGLREDHRDQTDPADHG